MLSKLLASAAVIALSANAAYAQLQKIPTYAAPYILSGLVPAPVGGEFNSPSLSVTIPAGIIAIPGPTYQSLEVPGDTLTLPANANTLICVNLIYGNLSQAANSCAAWSTPLYQVGTGTGWLAYIQGRMQVLSEAYPMPEVAENPNAVGSMGGVSLMRQSGYFLGNWLGVQSADPTNFAAEGLGDSTALDAAPHMPCTRFVPGRMPQPNDYLCEFEADGAGTENPNAIGVQYTAAITRIVDPHPATRAARMDLSTVDPANNEGSGTFARLSIGKGVWGAGLQGDVAGGDPGPYAINEARYLVAGVDVTSDLVRLIMSIDPAAAQQIRANMAEMAARPMTQPIPPRLPTS